MSFINIDGLNIYYEKKGKTGKTVLLLHGWGQNSKMMFFISDFLKEHFVTYNFDLPGFGESDEPKEVFDVDKYCEIIRSFVVKKKIDNPIIIGHSFGCRIALKYAYKYPVYKMVLTGAAGIRPKRTIAYYLKVYSYKLIKKILSIKGFEKIKEKYINNAGSQDYKETSGIMRQTFVKIVNEDLRPLLKDIKTPTLLVWGEKDEAVPLEMGKIMEKEMVDATLVIFEGDNHFAYYNESRRFNLVLDAYLKEDY